MEMKKKWTLFLTALAISIIIPVSVLALGTLRGNRLIFEVSTDKLVYDVNETVVICIRMINPTNSPKTLHFTSGYQVDYKIMQDSNVLYQWSADKAFIQMLTSITIPPHDSVIRCFNHKSEDLLLEPGTYEIHVFVFRYGSGNTTIVVGEETAPFVKSS